MVVKGPENVRLLKLINQFKREKKTFWKRIADFLAKPRRRRVAVNISKINRYGKEGKIVVIPGKVLGDAPLIQPLTVVAFAFSEAAKAEIEKAGGKAKPLEEFYQEAKDNVKDAIILI